jgi:hypothetical protein
MEVFAESLRPGRMVAMVFIVITDKQFLGFNKPGGINVCG